MGQDRKHRLELITYSTVASLGAFWCYVHHFWHGHLDHISHERLRPWIEDGVWLFALCAAAVVGMSGRFMGARSIGIVCSVLIVCMVAVKSPLGLIGAMILAILSIVQVWELLTTKKKPEAEPLR